MIFTLFPGPFFPRRQVVKFPASPPSGYGLSVENPPIFAVSLLLSCILPGVWSKWRFSAQAMFALACLFDQSRIWISRLAVVQIMSFRRSGWSISRVSSVSTNRENWISEGGRTPTPNPDFFTWGFFEFVWKSGVCPSHFVVSRRAFKMEKNDRSSPFLMNFPQKKCDG